MTDYNRGDIVLVNFVFTDETGTRRRPAVIVSSREYNKGRNELIIEAITSNVNRILVGDHLIVNWQAAGLLHPSVSTGIIRTIKQRMIDRKIGKMLSSDLKEIEDELKLILGLS